MNTKVVGKQPLVSVIAPVYNVEKYLPKMIDSVLNQTFTDFELLLVDDGSPDNCGKLCDDVARRDKRVRVIHQENGGSAKARNAGMDAANGMYFYFIDADDWIEADMLRTLVDTAQEYQCMLTITGFSMEYCVNGKQRTYEVSPEPVVYSRQENFREHAYQYFYRNILNVPWNKLYVAEYIRKNSIRFPDEYRQWNDVPFNMEYLKDVTSVVVTGCTMYHYICSRPGAEGSMISKNNFAYLLRKKQFECILELYRYWDIKDKRSMGELYAYHLSRMLKSIFEASVLPGMSLNERHAQIAQILSDPMTQKSLKNAEMRNIFMHVAISPMKWNSVAFCYLEGKIYNMFKKRLADQFYHLQSHIVNRAKIKK